MRILRISIFLSACCFALISPVAATGVESSAPVLSKIYESETLRQWFDEEYLTSHDAPELIERAAFVAIDVSAFKANIVASMTKYSGGATQHEAALTLRLFPDTEILIVPERFQIGSSQYATIDARLVNCDLTKREQFRFQISPEGRLSGYGATSKGNFQIQPTPESNQFLVIQVRTRRQILID